MEEGAGLEFPEMNVRIRTAVIVAVSIIVAVWICLALRFQFVAWNLVKGKKVDLGGRTIQLGDGVYYLPPPDRENVFIFSPSNRESSIHIQLHGLGLDQGRKHIANACAAMRCISKVERQYLVGDQRVTSVAYSYKESQGNLVRTRVQYWVDGSAFTLTYSGTQKELDHLLQPINELLAQLR